MSEHDELLRESVSRLEQALAGERTRREEAEATLAGLRCIAEAPDLAATDAAVLAGLRPLLRYQTAAVLVRADDDPDAFVAVVADHPALAALRWRGGSLLRRALAGQTVALYDVRRSPELAALGESPDLRSALVVPLLTEARQALLLAAPAEPAFFSPRHVALAAGFSRTAAQVLGNLAAREHAHHRRAAEDRAAALARTNEVLQAQLATIGAQQLAIQRLAAPILQVDREVLVVPLIGDLDADALARVTEALLAAITERRARAVILDLTGVEAPDDALPARLRALVRATELVGARCLVTGLRPAVAAALADAGAPLGAKTLRTLADGLAAARR